jgi:hypothetical protein
MSGTNMKMDHTVSCPDDIHMRKAYIRRFLLGAHPI